MYALILLLIFADDPTAHTPVDTHRFFASERACHDWVFADKQQRALARAFLKHNRGPAPRPLLVIKHKCEKQDYWQANVTTNQESL